MKKYLKTCSSISFIIHFISNSATALIAYLFFEMNQTYGVLHLYSGQQYERFSNWKETIFIACIALALVSLPFAVISIVNMRSKINKIIFIAISVILTIHNILYTLWFLESQTFWYTKTRV